MLPNMLILMDLYDILDSRDCLPLLDIGEADVTPTFVANYIYGPGRAVIYKQGPASTESLREVRTSWSSKMLWNSTLNGKKTRNNAKEK